MAATATVFTMGYQLRDLPEFVDELGRAAVQVVVDVRETPWSHKPGFSKTPLQAALANVGILYVHAAFGGNPKRLRRAAASHDECLTLYEQYLDEHPEILSQLDALFLEITEAKVPACFICYERHPDDCHRTILLKRWAETTGRRIAIQHLAPEGAPRLTTV